MVAKHMRYTWTRERGEEQYLLYRHSTGLWAANGLRRLLHPLCSCECTRVERLLVSWLWRVQASPSKQRNTIIASSPRIDHLRRWVTSHPYQNMAEICLSMHQQAPSTSPCSTQSLSAFSIASTYVSLYVFNSSNNLL